MLSRTPHLAYRHRAKQVRMKGDEMRSRKSPAPARKYIIFSIMGEREREVQFCHFSTMLFNALFFVASDESPVAFKEVCRTGSGTAGLDAFPSRECHGMRWHESVQGCCRMQVYSTQMSYTRTSSI